MTIPYKPNEGIELYFKTQSQAEKELIKAVRAVVKRCWRTGVMSFYSVAQKDMKALRAALRAWDKEQKNGRSNSLE